MTLGGSISQMTTDAGKAVATRRVIIQAVASVLGLLLMFAMACIDYDAILTKRNIIILFGIALLFMLAVVVFGEGERGNRNWIRIKGLPFDIQPSEFVKIFFIITFSKHIDLVKEHINHIKNLIPLGIHAGIIIVLVLKTGDLGSALVYIMLMLVMLFAAGLSLWYFAGMAVVGVIAFPFIWQYFLSEAQQMRILAGFNPDIDPLGKGYQAILSRTAIAAGGLGGAGITGGGAYIDIPDYFSDFLFAVLAEKFGFFGCFILMILMAVLIIRLIYIAKIARKDYGAFICMGVVAILFSQTAENIGMCLAMLPVVGITLPFFSYGGSSMLAMYMCVGVVQSIAAHNKKYYFEREPA